MRRILIKEDLVDFVVRELRGRAHGDRRVTQAAAYIGALRMAADGNVHVSLPVKLADECAAALGDAPTISKLFRTGDVA